MASVQSTASAHDEHKILCCLCATPIPPNPANMCINCIRGQVDISEDISKQEVVMFCKNCERYLQPPKYWVKCDLESRELLHLCVKRIKGLNKVKLIDANFIWTEPHSKRLKVKITVQKEVFNGTIVQQSFIVEFIVCGQQCETCQNSFTEKTWKAIVQVRQHVDHKRTMFFLEQLILKHNMHENTINIKERPDGLDFYFNHRSHGQKMVHFLSNFCPTKNKSSERLITHDPKSNIFNYKYSFSVDIAPICREDVVCLSSKVSKSLGGLGPIVLCYKVNAGLHFMDTQTLKVAEIPGNLFWKSPFKSVLSSRQLVEFTVLDVEPMPNVKHGKFQLADVQISRSDDMGDQNSTLFTKTHLGNILHPGDTVLGYDLRQANFNEDDMRHVKSDSMPDVILIRKSHDKKKKRKRGWKLKNLVKKDNADLSKTELQQIEKDRERFMQELEEDDEYRSHVQLYKDKTVHKTEASTTTNTTATEDNDDDDDALPVVPEKELLDLEESSNNVEQAMAHFSDEDLFEDDEEIPEIVIDKKSTDKKSKDKKSDKKSSDKKPANKKKK